MYRSGRFGRGRTKSRPAGATSIRAFRAALDFGHRVRMLRINGLDTRFAYRDLIEVVEAAGDRLDLVMLPKANSRSDVSFVDTLLTQMEAALRLRRGASALKRRSKPPRVSCTCARSPQSSPRLEALIFGPGDYRRVHAHALRRISANPTSTTRSIPGIAGTR